MRCGCESGSPATKPHGIGFAWLSQSWTSCEVQPQRALLPWTISHEIAEGTGAGMLSQQGAEGRGGTVPSAPFVLRNDDDGVLAVAGHSLRLACQGSRDELGELGSGSVERMCLHKSTMISIICERKPPVIDLTRGFDTKAQSSVPLPSSPEELRHFLAHHRPDYACALF